MTRRLILAILLTSWTTLVAGGIATYFVTRQVLLAELDASLVARARALPQILGLPGEPARAAIPPGDRYVIRNERGQVTGRSGGPVLFGGQAPPVVLSRSFATLPDGQRLRSLTLSAGAVHADGSPAAPLTIVYSSSADGFDRLLNRLALLLVTLGVAAGLASAYAAVRVVRGALRPLHQAAQAVGEIDERRLDRRINPAELPTELAPVAHRLNQMLECLDESFAQRRRFLADAAHELRTPIAALLTTLQVTLRKPREPEELIGALRSCLSETRLLRRLVDALLEHARGESPRQQPFEQVDISAILDECADMAAALGAEAEVAVTRSYPPGLAFVTQPRRFQSIVTNLLSNAVEYNHRGGSVDVACRRVREHGDLELTVRNSGPGIAPEHLPHVFQPFYRAGTGSGADAARSSDPHHLGLGLFIVESHVRALGGHAAVESEPATCTFVTVTLPMPAPHVAQRPGDVDSELDENASTGQANAHEPKLPILPGLSS